MSGAGGEQTVPAVFSIWGLSALSVGSAKEEEGLWWESLEVLESKCL